jgi:hypothetical protein
MRCVSIPVLLPVHGDIPPTAKIDGAVGSVSSADLHAVMLKFNEWISWPPQPVYRIHVANADRIDLHYQVAPGPYPEECRSFDRIKGKWRIGDICATW